MALMEQRHPQPRVSMDADVSTHLSQIPRGTAILFQWGDRKDRMARDEMTALPLPTVQSWVGSSRTLFLAGRRPSLAVTKAGQLIPRGGTESTEFS